MKITGVSNALFFNVTKFLRTSSVRHVMCISWISTTLVQEILVSGEYAAWSLIKHYGQKVKWTLKYIKANRT